MDLAAVPSGVLIETAWRLARRSQQNTPCQAPFGPEQLPTTAGVSHEGMDRGAAAREKNGANNLENHDRDGRTPASETTANHANKAANRFGVERMQKIRREALDAKGSFRDDQLVGCRGEASAMLPRPYAAGVSTLRTKRASRGA
jgi:hypothetical protein